MGYYTDYTLHIARIPNENIGEAIVSWLTDKQLIGYAFDKKYDFYPADDAYQLDLWCSDCCKWYEYDEDMTELSKCFPDCVFKLHGDGESSDDIWECYYQNGESELCQAYIPEPKTIAWP